MSKSKDSSEILEKVILIHVFQPHFSVEQKQQSVSEMRNLAIAAGAEVVSEITQILDHPHPVTYVGQGKVSEIKERALQFDANLVIFSVDLSGSQVRNLEQGCEASVIDRTQLILDIFARRAHSFEGKAQVKLAQMQYVLPRLSGQGSSMSRLGAGIGTRGPGETKLETDRRRIRREIATLRKIVDEEKLRRAVSRRRRSRQGVYAVSLVGYTNAGKTTMLSSLVKRYGEKQLSAGQNRLFDTLDPASRRLLYAGRVFVMTDTVGFIRDLPHHLIQAFRSSLESVEEADIIIHVVDASSPFALEEMATVYDVLENTLHARAPVITVLNKQDLVRSAPLAGDVKASAWMEGSALSEETIALLMKKIDEVVGRKIHLQLKIPFDRADLLAEIDRRGKLEKISANEQVFEVEAEVDEKEFWMFAPYQGSGQAFSRQEE